MGQAGEIEEAAAITVSSRVAIREAIAYKGPAWFSPLGPLVGISL